MSYKSTRRQWVKLWVNEWLDGTTRFELTAPQRLLWVDLLALAGRSRFPGYVYAGVTGDGKKVGYPICYLAGVLQMDEAALNNALLLLREHEHITLEESSPERYVIGIVNWEKYQSEYFRQKAYRKVTTKVTNQTTSRLPVDVEVEGDVEVEVEVEGEKIKAIGAKAAPPRATQFPKDFCLDEDLTAFANKFQLAPVQTFQHFRDHHTAKGSRFVDWKAAFRTWCRRAQAFGGSVNERGVDSFTDQPNAEECLFKPGYVPRQLRTT